MKHDSFVKRPTPWLGFITHKQEKTTVARITQMKSEKL
jgi:hypothetical protein